MGLGLSLNCELDCVFYGVDVLVVYMLGIEDTAGIVYITLPELGWVGVCRKGSGLYIFHD